MQTQRILLRVFGISLILLTVAVIAQAQATRTWVSGVGDDVNPCSRTAPCKTFAGAISKTATNGEINCLDPAGYGAVTVTKSITIDCEDTQGSILSAGTNGVIVNITSGTDTKKAFKLRGVSINGAGTGINGIRVLAASSVVLEEVVIDGCTQHGVSVETASGDFKLVINNSTIRSVVNGVNSFVSSGTSTVTVKDSLFANNTVGFNISFNSKGTLTGTTLAGNGIGVQTGSNAVVGVIDSLITNNTTGISALAGTTVRISGNMITNNGTGLSAAGSIISYGSNVLQGNTADGAPSSTVPLQ